MVEYDDFELLKISELKRYVRPKDYDLNNWKIILNRAVEVKPNLFEYKTNKLTLYFDDEMYIQEYGRVHIIDNGVYYDFNDSNEGAGTWIYLGEVNYA